MSAPCPDKEPMLHALLDGELDAANASALEAHLKTCPGCAQRLAALTALHQRLSELPPAPAPFASLAIIAAMRPLRASGAAAGGSSDRRWRRAVRVTRRWAQPGQV